MSEKWNTSTGMATDGRANKSNAVSHTNSFDVFAEPEKWWESIGLTVEYVKEYEKYELSIETAPPKLIDTIVRHAVDYLGEHVDALPGDHPVQVCRRQRAVETAAIENDADKLAEKLAADERNRQHNSPEAVAARLAATRGRSVAIDAAKIRSRNEATELVRQEQAAKRRGDAPRALPVSLADALAKGVPPTRWIVEGLLKGDSTCLLSGPFKAGKSAVTASLVRSLVDGDPYLGHFPVIPTAGNVMVVDTEQGMGELLEVYGSQKIRNMHRVHLVSTDGLASDWDLSLDENMDAAVSMCHANGVTVLVFDPLSPLFVAMGLDENDSSAQAPLVRFSELKRRAGLDAVVISHHSGYGGGGRARGSSSLPGWAAALWNITRDGDKLDSVRSFDAYGRGINVPPGVLSLGLDGRLQFVPASEAAQARRLSNEELKDVAHRMWIERYVAAEPGHAASFYAAKLGGGTADRGVQVPIEAGGATLVNVTKNGIETTVATMLVDGELINKGSEKRRELFVVPHEQRLVSDPIARPSNTQPNPFTTPAERDEISPDLTPNSAPFNTDQLFATPGMN